MVKRVVIGFVLAMASVLAAQVNNGETATAVDIPEYTQLLQACTAAPNDPVSCYVNEPGSVDSPVVYFVKCDAAANITNYCYDLKLNGQTAPNTLGVRARMTAYKTHDATVDNAQYEAAFHVYHVPQGGAPINQVYWGWGQRPVVQTAGADGADLSGILSATDVLNLSVKFKMHKIPQFNVFVSHNGTMDFTLTGNNLTFVAEGSPAKVAVESSTQHINFDTEKDEDTTKPWTGRCGFPSMRFVVCNVDKAESNPLLFYVRSSTMVNSPAGDTPGPIWVSTNATYFHFPSVSIDPKGNKQIQVKVASPHLLADNSTVNSGAFRTFLPNGLLTLWKIDKTENALKKALAASIKKAGKETVLERSFVISDLGVTINFPSLTYSAPEVYVTDMSASGLTNANDAYDALLNGTTATTTTTAAATTTTTTTAAPATTVAPVATTAPTPSKSLKKGSSTLLTKLLKPATGTTGKWSVKGACRVSGGKLIAVTKGKSCTLTLKQTNTKTKKTTTRTLAITVT